MTYRVFDTGINKLFGTFEREVDALALARTLMGDDDAEDIEVGQEMADGAAGQTLSGAALRARIDAVVSARLSGTARGRTMSGPGSGVAGDRNGVAAKGVGT
jgi:hypothetical protein